jgi:hypothetical protein
MVDVDPVDLLDRGDSDGPGRGGVPDPVGELLALRGGELL